VSDGLILDKVSYDFIDTKRAVDGSAILQFVVMFDRGVQFVLAFNLELQYASKRLRNHGASGGNLEPEDASASFDGRRF
jgi:hypothetical protein